MRDRLFQKVQNANEIRLKELAAQASDLIAELFEPNYLTKSSKLALYFQKTGEIEKLIFEIDDIILKLNPKIQQKLQNAIKNDLTPSTFAKKLMGTEKYTQNEFQKEKLKCDAIIEFLESPLKNSSEGSLEPPPGYEKALSPLSL